MSADPKGLREAVERIATTPRERFSSAAEHGAWCIEQARQALTPATTPAEGIDWPCLRTMLERIDSGIFDPAFDYDSKGVAELRRLVKRQPTPSAGISEAREARPLTKEQADGLVAAVKLLDGFAGQGLGYDFGDGKGTVYADEVCAKLSEAFIPNWDGEWLIPAIKAALATTPALSEPEQRGEAYRPIMLEMAEADERHVMWERRWKALMALSYHDTRFVDQGGRWSLSDFIAYAGECCGFAAANPVPAEGGVK